MITIPFSRHYVAQARLDDIGRRWDNGEAIAMDDFLLLCKHRGMTTALLPRPRVFYGPMNRERIIELQLQDTERARRRAMLEAEQADARWGIRQYPMRQIINLPDSSMRQIVNLPGA
jgi:hypothetical protein